MSILRGGRRVKTAREDALHDVVQRAMNWDPKFPTLQKDGKWRDGSGNECIAMTLEGAVEYFNLLKKKKKNE